MDDGLLLNLDLEDVATGPPKVKSGGRWTDRAKANRLAKKRKRDAGDILDPSPDLPKEKPPKKSRIDPISNTLLPSKPSVARPPGQVISSLFTSNPKVDAVPQSSVKPAAMAPSNAPLKDSTSFEGMGLDPLLVTQLCSKMNISAPTAIQRASISSITTQDTSEHRDLFIQAQTGSGKTLAYLLPIIHDLLPLCSLSYIDRSIGTLAIIIAPTRELAQQISTVLETLLQMRLSPRESERAADDSEPRRTRWLVSGVLTGGATRTHEKARLRKGVPILVSTPGRLLDHLQNTESFHVAKCRWLVLDEADRLLELGFEETLTGILKSLDGRRNLAIQAATEGGGLAGEVVGGWDWRGRRRTILCSATIKEDVQKLAGTALVKPIVIKGGASDLAPPPPSDIPTMPSASIPSTQFTPPSQLSQKYVVVPLKLRLVTLVSLLRSLMSPSRQSRRSPVGAKIIVFLSCTDSVDFHWKLFGSAKMQGEDAEDGSSGDSGIEDGQIPESEDEDPKAPKTRAQTHNKGSGFVKVETQSTLLPNASIFRLHGSLPLSSRQASVRGFSSTQSTKPKTRNQPVDVDSGKKEAPRSSILLCTSVASRGLDLPLVKAVVQYDLPTEGGSTEYVHRVGRTARAGKGGEAWAFVAPEETAWVKWVTERMNGAEGASTQQVEPPNESSSSIQLQAIAVDSLLQSGFGGTKNEPQARATEVQLSFERWVLKSKENSTLTQKAFQSHMRAYSTHPSDEKHIFHIRNLHIGHLAKSFALRDAPSTVSAVGTKHTSKSDSRSQKPHSRKPVANDKRGRDTNDAADRMGEVVRQQGRLSKADGRLMSHGGLGEFQVAGGGDLERVVHRRR